MKENINPVDDLIGDIANAANEWVERQKVLLVPEITGRLNKARDEILMKLLGFDKDYGGSWKVDHCNGRNGQSIAGDFLKVTQQAAVEDWLKQVPLPVLTDELQEVLRADIQKQYEYTLRHYASEYARAKAKKDLEALVAEIVPSKQIENFLKLRELIEQPTTETN